MANDAARAARAAAEGAGADGGPAGPPPPWTFEALLRELVDEKTYPRLHRIAWTPAGGAQPSEREEFLFGVDTILDGVQALIDQARLRVAGAVEVAKQGDLGTVVQDLLVHPPERCR